MTKFRTWDGLELSYRVWEGEGTPIVLQHGVVGDTNANWMSTGVVAALQGIGRTVISLDARGHGRSDKPHDPAPYTWTGMAKDVRALYDELGLDEVVQVGYSMGGVISLLVAAQDTRVRRLVVGGIGSGVIDCGGIDRRAIELGSLIAAMGDEPVDVPPLAAKFRFLADVLGADRAAIRAVAAGLDDRPIGALDGITAPTLVLAGAEDPLAVEPDRLAAALPDGRAVVVPGEHMLAVAAPEFAAALVEFVK
ncbi:alpha/beta fold hydrolase [Nocardia takedensis]|uniref:alpha/beta fold hydrolase n=1 Tax=Nocardia takedensis TaxID=259390 RepID=UPI0002ED7763|nr:alpha/beta fold hydrolase [Nocardia takedensis]